MADGTPQNGTALVAADEITTDNGVTVSARQAQRIKLDSKGVDGAFTDVSQAAPLPVMRPDAATTGTIMVTDAVVPAPTGNGALLSGASTALSLIALACPGGDSAWNVQITGLTSGTLYFEGSLDSTSGTDGNWINVNGRRTGVVNTELAGNATANGVWRGNTSGLVYFRVRAVGALVGTPAIRIRISDGTGAVFLNASIPPGTNSLGAVTVADSTATGTIAAAAASVALALDGDGGVAVQISGTWVGTLQFEGTIDGVTWYPINAVRVGSSNIPQIATINGLHRLTPAGLAQVRVTATAWTSGTATINIRASAGTGGTFANQILPMTDGSEINASFRGRAQTFRTPGRAGTAGQKIFALHNATGSTKIVTINQVTVDLVQTVAKAVTVLPPVIRVHRFTALPTNGTALSKAAKDSALTTNASITAWGDASADGTGSATTLTITIPAGNMLSQEFAPRLITAAGYEMADRLEMLVGQGIVLRPLEGIVVFLDYVLATQNPITDMWIVGCDWYEV